MAKIDRERRERESLRFRARNNKKIYNPSGMSTALLKERKKLQQQKMTVVYLE